jgi:Tfp pilus assembly protein PilV
MKDRSHNPGFSLTEVLLAVGTLAIGMLFIAGTFLAGVYFTTVSTERTIAAIAADEAFAKIRIYGVNPAGLAIDRLSPFLISNPAEFAYPSTDTVTDKQYYWSALCRQADPNQSTGLIQVTVFVSRKIAAHTRYRNPTDPFNSGIALTYPVPVEVGVSRSGPASNVLTVETGKEMFINDGYTIVNNQSGQIYRVVERDAAQPNRIILDRVWVSGASAWVVPPPFDSGRYPCIAVYPKVIKF